MDRVRIRRIYDQPSAEDGTRVLVDRLWPRGLTKEAARVDRWLREIAPSAELRRWFGHAPERWPEFRRRYAGELERNPDAVAELHRLAAQGPVTLLFAARDETRNNAVILRDLLLGGPAG
ncbi:MAG: DUF488 family protein [Magnetospirillum sp.]|nr:DUF488 family protein [Magnetospirillum sp.]